MEEFPALAHGWKEPPAAQKGAVLTDERVYDLLDRQYQDWGGRSIRAQVIAVVGPVALDGATVAATIAAMAGTTATRGAAMVGIWGFVARAFGLIDLVNRANALEGGLGLLREADAKYLFALAAGRYKGVMPTDKLTPIGARLAADIYHAQEQVAKAMISIIQKPSDLEAMRAVLDKALLDMEAREKAEADAILATKKTAPPASAIKP